MYTFNGIGEYFMIYTNDSFIYQARTTRAVKADGNLSDATVFSAFAARDISSNSGVVRIWFISHSSILSKVFETAK